MDHKLCDHKRSDWVIENPDDDDLVKALTPIARFSRLTRSMLIGCFNAEITVSSKVRLKKLLS